MVTFSVVIPHHNIPRLLLRCLDSIPDIPDVQVIVVDDNSSESEVDFSNFPGKGRKYTSVIFDKAGGGAGRARNIGMQHATGKWLVFADADDFFVDGAFDILQSHSDDAKDIILFKADSVDSQDYTPSDRHIMLNKAIDNALSGVRTAKWAVLKMPVPWCKMFSREYIQRNALLFDEIYANNDMMFVLKSVYSTSDEAVAVTNEVLYTVTTRKGSLDDMKKSSTKSYLCMMDVLIRCNKFAKDGPYERRPIIVQVFRALKVSPNTFWQSLKLAVKERALFSGISVILKKIFKR